MDWKRTDAQGSPLKEETLFRPYSGEKCRTCGMKPTCNGCGQCGKCKANEDLVFSFL